MADDLVDQQLTDTLQQLDHNFAQAHDAAAKLLVQVKAYAQRVRRVHAAASAWQPFFDKFKEQAAGSDDAANQSMRSQHTSFSREDVASYQGPATPATPPYVHSAGRAEKDHESRVLNFSDVSISFGSPPASTPFLHPRTAGKRRRGDAAGAAGQGHGAASAAGAGTGAGKAAQPDPAAGPYGSPAGGLRDGDDAFHLSDDSLWHNSEGTPSVIRSPPRPTTTPYYKPSATPGPGVGGAAAASVEESVEGASGDAGQGRASEGAEGQDTSTAGKGSHATPGSAASGDSDFSVPASVIARVRQRAAQRGEGGTGSSGGADDDSGRGGAAGHSPKALDFTNVSPARGKAAPQDSARKRRRVAASTAGEPSRRLEEAMAASAGTPVSLHAAGAAEAGVGKRSYAEDSRINELLHELDEADGASLLEEEQEERGEGGAARREVQAKTGDSVLDESDSEDGGPAEFRLDAFPPAFRSGEGARQLTAIFSQFDGARGSALSLDQLAQRVEGVERPMVQLMLDTLVSRRLLRSFVLNGVLYWQRG